MNSVYESIMAGLNEAVADAESGGQQLPREVVSIPEGKARIEEMEMEPAAAEA